MINRRDNIGELGDENIDDVELRELWGGLDKVLCERFGEDCTFEKCQGDGSDGEIEIRLNQM
jgi:hypothetical protein